jgi:hypothetical protein
MAYLDTCNGSLLVFVSWSTPSPLSSKWFDLKLKLVSNKVRSTTLKITLTLTYPKDQFCMCCHWSSLKPKMDHHHEAIILIFFVRKLFLMHVHPNLITCLSLYLLQKCTVCSFSLFIVELHHEVVSPSLPSFHHLNLSFFSKGKGIKSIRGSGLNP